MFPVKSGGYILPVKAEVRRKADIAAGDEVTVELELLLNSNVAFRARTLRRLIQFHKPRGTGRRCHLPSKSAALRDLSAMSRRSRNPSAAAPVDGACSRASPTS